MCTVYVSLLYIINTAFLSRVNLDYCWLGLKNNEIPFCMLYQLSTLLSTKLTISTILHLQIGRFSCLVILHGQIILLYTSFTNSEDGNISVLLLFSFFPSKACLPLCIWFLVPSHNLTVSLLQPHTAHLNHHTLKLLKNWTWQFVVIRPVCSILMIVLQLLGVYPSWVSWTFTMILNISVSLALYSLVIFYHVFAKELAPHKPLAKFLCVKGIVFFVFWQVLLSSFLTALSFAFL